LQGAASGAVPKALTLRTVHIDHVTNPDLDDAAARIATDLGVNSGAGGHDEGLGRTRRSSRTRRGTELTPP
jgi:hypothetical protein